MRASILAMVLLGCHSSRVDPPQVERSSDSPADQLVRVTTRGHFSPPCVTIEIGQTVEWDNTVGLMINVTSAAVRGRSPELFSPMLVGSAAAWRHTFASAGRVDYFDQGGASGGAVDPYYGTLVTAGAGAAQGTVCVRAPDGSGCDSLCCMKGDPTRCQGGACSVIDDPQVAYGFCTP
jgi:hypothetical protein